MGYASRLQSPKPGSKHGSRPQSRQVAEDDDELSNYGITFSNLDQLIAQRLESFYKTSTEDQKTKYPMHNVKLLSEVLINPKTPIPSEDREMLLNQMYTLNVKNPQASIGLFHDMVQVFKVSQGLERLIAIRNVAATGIAHCEDIADEVIELLDYLEKKIASDDLDNSVKQQFVYAHGAMTLAVYEGSGAYGVDDKLHFLQEILLGLNADVEANADVISALLYSIGGIFTLFLRSSNLTEELEMFLESSMDYLLDYDILEIQRPMAMIAGLAYEIYPYVDDIHSDEYDADDEIQPYGYTHQVEQRLRELIGGNSKGNKKNEKLDSRSVFRESLHTIQTYSQRANRIQMADKSYEFPEQVLTHIKLSKTRSIAVKSWISLLRLVLLKWAFGVGLYNQLAHSSNLASMVQYTHKRTFVSYKQDSDDDVDDDFGHDNSKVSNKKKQKEIANRRMEKLNDKMEQTGINNDSD
jgi:hypothetical protein